MSEKAKSSTKGSLKELKQIEVLSLILGCVMVLGSIAFKNNKLTLGVLYGVIFACVNFRLLVWSWGAVIEQRGKAESNTIHLLSRFALKYVFFIAGLLLVFGGFKAHPLGFGVGVGCILLGLIFSPLLPKNKE